MDHTNDKTPEAKIIELFFRRDEEAIRQTGSAYGKLYLDIGRAFLHNEEDAEEKAAIELARRLGKDRAATNQSVADGLKGYIR